MADDLMITLHLLSDELDDEERADELDRVRKDFVASEIDAHTIEGPGGDGAKGGIAEFAIHIAASGIAEFAFVQILERFHDRLRRKATIVVEGPNNEKIDLSVIPADEWAARIANLIKR